MIFTLQFATHGAIL